MKRLLGIAIVATLGLAACGSSSKTASSSSSTSTPGSTAAARTSDTVTLLTHDAFAASKSVLADFTKQTGFKLKLVQPGDAGVMVNEAILRKDHPVADAIYGVDNTFLTRALNEGIFSPYEAKGLDLKPNVPTDAQHRVTPIDTGDVCVNYDKSYFGSKGHPPAPTSLDDLTKPDYKNLTVVENAATSSPGLAFLLATIAKYGGDGWQQYWKDLKKNGVRVVNDWSAAYETDFTAGGGPGDRPIVVSYGSSPPADVVYSEPHRDTTRVGVVDTSCFHQIEYAGVLAHAKNPAGAQALIDFMAGKTFQEDMPLQMFVFPTNAQAKLPPEFTKFAVSPAQTYTPDAQQIADHRDEWIKEWTDIAGR
jgi:thiamine transport system substrate-binding protein